MVPKLALRHLASGTVMRRLDLVFLPDENEDEDEDESASPKPTLIETPAFVIEDATKVTPPMPGE